MDAGTNVARSPIDLETVRRNLREVMDNLQLVEYGQNVGVEDLIRQARENLNQNRLFIWQNLGQNQENDVLNNTDNRVLTVQLERLNPASYEMQPNVEDAEPPIVHNPGNNADRQVDHNQGGNVEQNLPNGGGNDPVGLIADRVREWAERYERDWGNFRQNRPTDDGNLLQNQPNARANQNVPNVNDQIAQNLRNYARQRFGIVRPPPIPNFGAVPGQRPNLANGDHPRAANERENLIRAPHNFPAGMMRWEPYQRPQAPARDAAGLERRIGELQERLDRLEDERFYEVMIEGRGQDRIRHMIRTLIQRQNRPNGVPAPPPRQNAAPARPDRNAAPAPPAHQNVNNAGPNPPPRRFQFGLGMGRWAPNWMQNRPCALVRIPNVLNLPPRAPNQTINQRFAPVRLPNVPNLPPRAPNQTINQRFAPVRLPNVPNLPLRAPNQPISQRLITVKRPNTAEYPERDDDQDRAAKQLKIDKNDVPGTSSDPAPPPQSNDGEVASCSNTQRNRSDLAQDSSQNMSNNENSQNPAQNKNKYCLKNTSDDLIKAGPSRSLHCSRNIENNSIKITMIDSSVFDDLDDSNSERNNTEKITNNTRANSSANDSDSERNNTEHFANNKASSSVSNDSDSSASGRSEQEVNNIAVADNGKAGETAQREENADVIIVSAHFPVRIKVERVDDEDDAQNNPPVQVNAAQNPANPPVDLQNPMAPYIPAGVHARQNGGDIRPWPAVVLNRALDARIRRRRGQEFPDAADRPLYVTLETVVRGLRNLLAMEERYVGRENRLAAHVLDNGREQIQLRMIQTYFRLRRELREVFLITERLNLRRPRLGMYNNNILFSVSLVGPPGSPYDEAEIGVNIKLLITPDGCETMVSLSHRIWHPNICPFTRIILPVYQWNEMTLTGILACIRRLLLIPELDKKTHAVIARQYLMNKEVFNRTAQHWTSVYGRGRNDHLAIPEYTELLERLTEEEIPKDRALHLLSKNDWNIDKAMDEVS